MSDLKETAMPTQDKCDEYRDHIYGKISELRNCVKSKVGRWVLVMVVGIASTVIGGVALLTFAFADKAGDNAIQVEKVCVRTDNLKEDVEEIKEAQRTADWKLDKILDRLPRKESD